MNDRTSLSYTSKASARQRKLKEKIDETNQALKEEGCTPRIRLSSGGSLSLRFTYQEKRREISPPGITASLAGLRAIEVHARRISSKIRDGEYTDEWLDTAIRKIVESSPALTAFEMRAKFADKWLEGRKGDASYDRQKQHTLKNYIGTLGRLYRSASITDADTFNSALIDRLLNVYPEGSDGKFRAKEVLSIACSLFNVHYSFKRKGKRPKAKERTLPTDNEIIQIYANFNNIKTGKDESKIIARNFYQWVLGILATYGLRPQEIFAIDWTKSFNPETKNWLFLDESQVGGIKTGDRAIPPLYPEWIEMFDLKNKPISPSSTLNLDMMANKINRYFLTHNVSHPPYNFRHAYAIRGHRLKKPLAAMARAMGHDVTTHVRIYQRWISIEDQIEAFEGE